MKRRREMLCLGVVELVLVFILEVARPRSRTAVEIKHEPPVFPAMGKGTQLGLRILAVHDHPIPISRWL